jgi:hypothetical protein
MADIAQTEDTNHPLALIDHRQSADLQLLHVLHALTGKTPNRRFRECL